MRAAPDANRNKKLQRFVCSSSLLCAGGNKVHDHLATAWQLLSWLMNWAAHAYLVSHSRHRGLHASNTAAIHALIAARVSCRGTTCDSAAQHRCGAAIWQRWCWRLNLLKVLQQRQWDAICSARAACAICFVCNSDRGAARYAVGCQGLQRALPLLLQGCWRGAAVHDTLHGQLERALSVTCSHACCLGCNAGPAGLSTRRNRHYVCRQH